MSQFTKKNINSIYIKEDNSLINFFCKIYECFYFNQATKAEWYSSVTDGPVVAMKRSPFFSDIILVAGGTGFNIWREKVFVSI